MFGFLLSVGRRIRLVISLLILFVDRPIRCLSEMFEKFSKFRGRLDMDEETCFQDLVSFLYHSLGR